jgi:[ribosomal protein S5]-alanine N-acetyltransferase
METSRLILELLHENDHAFIKELLNTEGWIKFIGNRNIHSKEDAIAYIQRINSNPSITYYTTRLKENDQPIGLVTLIQRDYLDQPDIGFAFLPGYAGKGYAYEASGEVMKKVLQDENIHSIHAVTLPDNITSISLVKKLGLLFDKSIDVNQETLHLYTYKK